jgi:glycosyltransferase involved in cell wall biosynthesis
VPLGINVEGYEPRAADRSGPVRVGYLARIAPEKGLHVLVDAYRVLRTRQPDVPVRLVAAGYLPPEHEGYLQSARDTLRAAGLDGEFEYRGELDRPGKIAFLRELDVFSVPTTYQEPKGLFLLEAMACGVPVVQPRVGAFPEIVGRTGGGLVVDATPHALADGILSLCRDPARARALGGAGAAGVREHYTVAHMAETAEAIYLEIAGRRPAAARQA